MVRLQGCALLGSVRRDGFAHEELIPFSKERAHETALNIWKQTERMNNQVLEPSLPLTSYVVLGYLKSQFLHVYQEVPGHYAL